MKENLKYVETFIDRLTNEIIVLEDEIKLIEKTKIEKFYEKE